MTTISVLHLSDVHISERSHIDQKIILEALFADLRQQGDGNPFDLILFSGDLIARGDYSEANQNFVENALVGPLLGATCLSSEKLFFVPGNHDFQLSKFPNVLRPSLDAVTSVSTANTMIDAIDQSPYLWTGFGSYNGLIARISTAKPVFSNALFSAHTISIGDLTVGIACINSAWKATGAPNDGDYGKLLVGQRQIDLLLSALKECQVKLAVMHHPLSWLALFDQGTLQQQLYREFDAIFYGHNHSADSLQIAGPQYSTFVSNAGCLYQSRDWFNGYSIVRYESEESVWRVHVREYYGNRNTFDVSTRFAEQGEACFKVALDRTSMYALRFPTVEYVSAVRESVNGHLLTTTISDVAPRNLASLFVLPPLSHVSEKQLGEDSTNGEEIKYLALAELLATRQPIFFVGPKECGKTTLLHYICTECGDFGGSRLPSFGCYINLQAVRSTSAGLLEAIVNFSNGAYRRSEFVDLLKAGRMTVCFDNLPVDDDKLLAVLAQFIRDYPSNSFHFAVSESFQSSITGRVIPRLGLDASVVYLHSFGRRQTRSLISKWFGESHEALRDRVDSMLASLRRLNIPRSPFLISILLWVQEKNIRFSPVNQAEIIDVLIDGILDKLNETKELSHYDSTAKRDFLTELAFHMHQAGKSSFSHNELDRFAANYFADKGLPAASGPFLEGLKHKGVLSDLGEEVSFKFDCLRAFFLSVRISESKELFDFAMTPDGFVSLSDELDYFTGKHRNKREALSGALSVVEDFFKQTKLDLDLDLFNQISLNESPITLEQKTALEKTLLGERPTLEKQEEILDEMDGPALPVLRVKRPKNGEKAQDFLIALRTASAILRNSELINDVELKHAAYEKLVHYWCQVLLAVLASIELYEDAQEENAVRELIPGIPQELAIYLMKLMAPNVIFAMTLESLGTPKLELMIKKNIEDESSATVCRLLSSVLYSDLDLSERLTTLKNLVGQKGASRFLIELVFFKLLHLFMFRKLSTKEATQIKPMIGDLFARLSTAKTHVAANQAKANIIKYLDRKKLMQESASSAKEG